MNIVFASNSGMSRQRVLSYLSELKANDSNFSVVDIGGAINPWSAAVADCYVDMNETTGHETIRGDIHDPAVWREIRGRNFDFVICSHLLEDIRDPLFVLSRMRETFTHGYIAMPSKHVEFGHIESRHYIGYGHHRWIYTLAGDELRLIAKLPLAAVYSPKRSRYLRLLASSAAGRHAQRLENCASDPSSRSVALVEREPRRSGQRTCLRLARNAAIPGDQRGFCGDVDRRSRSTLS